MRIPALALATTLLALAGCTPATTPTPTPIPTFRCTPETGGTDYQCTEHDFTQMQAKEAAYTEAERVLRAFIAEDSRITFHSTEAAPSDLMKTLIVGPMLEKKVSAYAALREQGFSGGIGDTTLSWTKRSAGTTKAASVVALEACIDGTHVQVKKGEAVVGSGRAIRAVYFFERDAGLLKIADLQGREVAAC